MTAAHQQRTALTEALEELAEAHAELERKQAFTDALLETIDVGIVFCDAEGRGVVRNRSERSMLGLGAADGTLEAGPAAALIEVRDEHGHLLAPEQYPIARALAGELVRDVNLKLGPAGGELHDVVVNGSRLTGLDGQVTGAVVAVTDVSTARAAERERAEERRQLAQAQHIGRLGSFTYDPATQVYALSAQLRALWGFTDHPDSGDDVEQARTAMFPEDAPGAVAALGAALVAGGRHSWTYRIRRPNDGEVRHLTSTVEVTHDAYGVAIAATGTHQDITHLVEVEQRAVRASGLFEAILSATPDYTFVTDLETGAVVYGTPGKTILGRSSEELQALGPALAASLAHAEDLPRLRATNVAAGSLGDGEVLQIRYRARHTDGSWHWLSRRVTPFRRDEQTGKVLEVLGVVRDVTDVVEAEERLTFTALHDPLTGLPNRALLMDRLEAALGRAQQSDRDVAILFCDLDGFKRVNDTAGHAAGDAVLVATAAQLKGVLRENDTIARVGGDEFVIIVEPWDRDDPTTGIGTHDSDQLLAKSLATRIASVLREPVLVAGVGHVVSASIGITYAGRGTVGTGSGPLCADEVLQNADAAMYRAKQRGKDRYEIFEHGLRADLVERGRVEHVLRRALHAGPVVGPRRVPSPRVREPELTPAYQPVFDLDAGTLVGFEALARLNDEDGNAIEPGVFIDVAEDTGLIRPVGQRMLDLACAQLAAWRVESPGLALTMAVNVSALQASHSFLSDDVHRALRESALRPSDLVLELTETALLQAGHSTLAALHQLRDEGVGIAIDDFGVGYASLRYLATLPVTAVKIDRSFTAGLPHDATSRKIVSAVAGLAADMDLECIIEGVETLAQHRALPAGVRVQGYFTGRPEVASRLRVAELSIA